MSYNTDNLRTAGKITVYTSLIGVLVFAVVFVFNLGSQDIKQVVAQSDLASTSVTVLNTPPQWTASSTELIESSTTTPTNAGDVVSWVAVATDSNNEPYYLLICSTDSAPTATPSGAPNCAATSTQWAVSPQTPSGSQATAATTSLDSWYETNEWYAWICDDNNLTPRCNTVYTQGTNATNSSPFSINHRPDFKFIWDDSPKEPGQMVTFTSTSTDNDASGTPDRVRLFVCSTQSFNTVTDTCSVTTLASTTALAANNATATYTIVIPTQDQNYGAYGYVIDSHGFEATTTQGTDSILSVSNVAPYVSSSTIALNGGNDMILSVEAGQTTGFTLQFAVSDFNSCDSIASTTLLGDEITNYQLTIYREGSGVGSTTCTPGSILNPNNCYPSTVATTSWNLVCTASTTSCTGATDRDKVYDCTFPLWYVADPTDGTATSTQFSTNDWRAQVLGADEAATGTLAQSNVADIEVTSFLAFALNTLEIPYGSLEPGQKNEILTATSTIAATGNVGLDKDVQGESMCTTYTASTKCPNSASSTISEYNQVFATSSVTYNTASSSGNKLSSTTPKLIDLNVQKSTSTSSPAVKDAYWGINVPNTITYAGSYTGQNTFTARVSSSTQW